MKHRRFIAPVKWRDFQVVLGERVVLGRPGGHAFRSRQGGIESAQVADVFDARC